MNEVKPALTRLREAPEDLARSVQCLRVEIGPDAIGKSTDGKIPVSGLANTGKPSNHWWWGNFALDLSGGSANEKGTWFLWDHDRNKQIGLFEVSFSEAGIMVDGYADETLLKTLDDGERIEHLLNDGYPVELSVYFDKFLDFEDGVEVLGENQTAMVNGYEITGPGHVFRKFVIREVSGTTLGHDHETSVARLAAQSKLKGGDMATPSQPPAAPDTKTGAQDLSVLQEGQKQLAAENAELKKQLAAIAAERKQDKLTALMATAGLEKLDDADFKAISGVDEAQLTAIDNLLKQALAKAKEGYPEIPEYLLTGELATDLTDESGEKVSSLVADMKARG